MITISVAIPVVMVVLTRMLLVLLVGEVALPLILVGVFFLDAQQHLLANDALEQKRLLIWHWMPIGDPRGIRRLCVLANGQHDGRDWVLRVDLLRVGNWLNSGRPYLILKARDTCDFPDDLVAYTTYLLKDVRRTFLGSDQYVIS